MQTRDNFIDSLTEKVSSLLSGNGESGKFSDELRKNLRAMVESAVRKLDIVSREEFETQAAVLRRSLEKIEQLEQQLEELSGQIEKSA